MSCCSATTAALILRQLEAKNDTGCSVADLRFAFPVLPVDQIMDILANVRQFCLELMTDVVLTVLIS